VLTVSVQDPTGQGVPGATVSLVDPDANAIVSKGTTGTDGRLQISGAGDRHVYVIAALAGFHATGAEAFVPRGCEGDVVISLQVAGTICDVEVETAEPAVDEQGAAPAGRPH